MDSQLIKYFAQKAPAGRLSGSKYNSSTLRAYPPTRLHAPYLYVPCILAPCPASAMRMLTPWVGGTTGPKGGAPGGAGGGARADARCARARADARAARAGALRAPGPLGDRLYATKAMPNGIDNTDERYSVWNGRAKAPDSALNPSLNFKLNVSWFPPVLIPYGIAFVGIIYSVWHSFCCV